MKSNRILTCICTAFITQHNTALAQSELKMIIEHREHRIEHQKSFDSIGLEDACLSKCTFSAAFQLNRILLVCCAARVESVFKRLALCCESRLSCVWVKFSNRLFLSQLQIRSSRALLLLREVSRIRLDSTFHQLIT